MKYFSLILLLSISFILYGFKVAGDEIIITGHLEGVEDGTIITLSRDEGTSIVKIQTDTVVSGTFRFVLDSVDQTTLMSIMSKDEGFPPTWLDVWVAPGEIIKIKGTDKLIQTWDVESDIPEQRELNIYNDHTRDVRRVKQICMRDAYSYFRLIDQIPEKKGEYEVKIDSLYAIVDSLEKIMIKKEIDLLDQNKTYSVIWLDILFSNAYALRDGDLPQEQVDIMKSLYNSIPDRLRQDEKVQSIRLSLFPPVKVKVGDDMADSDMWDMEGNLCHLADYKGKYILLNFWSQGCGPCLMAMPEMKEISEMYKDRLTLVSISSDSKKAWKEISKEKGISWINLNDFKERDGIWMNYGVIATPYYVIISPEGKILNSWPGYNKGSLKSIVKESIKTH